MNATARSRLGRKSGLARNDRDLRYKNTGEGAGATRNPRSPREFRGYGCTVTITTACDGTLGRELAENFSQILVLPEISNPGAEVQRIVELLPAHVDRLFAGAAVEEHHRAAAVGEWPRPDLKIALFPDAASLAAERILIDGDHFLVGEDLVDLGVMLRRSLPAISGAASMDHRLKCERYSVVVMPPLPTSSMSGSFQWPGPA